MKKQKKLIFITLIVILMSILFNGCDMSEYLENSENSQITKNIVNENSSTSNTIPEYNGKQYVEINGNIPEFSKTSTQAYATYTGFDDLGRTGAIESCIGPESISTEERDDISKIHPTGWKQEKYPYVVGGNGYLYQRCHLLGHQLGGDDKDYNLVTGTAYFNAGTTGEGTSTNEEGGSMLTWENMVRNHVEDTNCHVMYRVTPVYDGDDLVCRGVKMEAKSVENDGLSFNVFVFNVQPGITINYATGSSIAEE